MPFSNKHTFIRINSDSWIPERISRRNVPLLSRRSCRRIFSPFQSFYRSESFFLPPDCRFFNLFQFQDPILRDTGKPWAFSESACRETNVTFERIENGANVPPAFPSTLVSLFYICNSLFSFFLSHLKRPNFAYIRDFVVRACFAIDSTHRISAKSVLIIKRMSRRVTILKHCYYNIHFLFCKFYRNCFLCHLNLKYLFEIPILKYDDD